uniref:hypothetical protein n=1 Tax=Serratia proteamaculans TaxID=28151 RepID=UPI001F4C1267|nr:hypothetical protein [Serratia proteamaculans]
MKFNVIFPINLPRIKQGLEFSETFRRFNVVSEHANYSVSLVEKTVGRALQSEEKSEVPFFLSEYDFYIILKIRNI